MLTGNSQLRGVLVLTLLVLHTYETLSRCDFEIVSLSDEKLLELTPQQKGKPLLLRNFVSDWPLQEDNFMEKFGHLKVQTGSESSIVYSHGSADSSTLLRDLSQPASQGSSERYSFDTDVGKKNPQLVETYPTPTILSSIFNTDSNAQYVLSAGNIGAGLPPHTHGDAYLGLISGCKHWLLFPPGYSAPLSLQKTWNPFLPTSTWLKKLYQLNSSNSNAMQCVQQPGDIVYIPAGWSHSTLNEKLEINDDNNDENNTLSNGIENAENLSVTIGIGMQNMWLAETRETFCRKVLSNHPHDYEALKGVATSIFHRYVQSSSPLKEDDTSLTTTIDNELDEAVACLRKAIDMRPSYPEVRILLVTILFRRGKVHFENAKIEMRKLENLLDQYVSLDSDSDEINNLDDNRVECPVSQLSSARGIAAALYRLSLPLSANGLESDALRILQKSINLDGTNPKALAQRIFLFQASGDYKSAIGALEEMNAITSLNDSRGRAMLLKMRLQLEKHIQQ